MHLFPRAGVVLAGLLVSGALWLLPCSQAGPAVMKVNAAAASSDEFIPSTPEMQHKGFSFEGEKEKIREALDTLYDAGVSPMAVVEKLFDREKVEEAGDKLVEDAGQKVEETVKETKKSFLSSLQESMKQAADSLVDALFSKL